MKQMFDSKTHLIIEWITHSGWATDDYGLMLAAETAWHVLDPEVIVNSFQHIIKRVNKCIDFGGRWFEGEQHPIQNEE